MTPQGDRSPLSIDEMRALLDGAPGKSDEEVRRIHEDLARFAALTVRVYQSQRSLAPHARQR